MATSKPKKSEKRGPKPETLVIEGPWEKAVDKALKKSPPPAKPKKS